MQRILVIGIPGAGKSTFSRKLAARTGLPLIQLDREFWQPGWKMTPLETWRARQVQHAQRDPLIRAPDEVVLAHDHQEMQQVVPVTQPASVIAPPPPADVRHEDEGLSSSHAQVALPAWPLLRGSPPPLVKPAAPQKQRLFARMFGRKGG